MYTTKGTVRGNCGHKHRTLKSVHKFIERDQNGCAKQGGYSDRYIVRCDGKDLSENEQQDLDYCEFPD